MHAIDVRGLVKTFGDLRAVDGISFSVKRGELFGLLGPNGAGKTTTISMLSTLLQPTEGRAMVMGHDITKEQDTVRHQIGLVFQDPSLDGKLTGRENLNFHAMIYGMSKEERTKRIEELLSLVELEDKAKALVETYSGGMKRRLEIARGLLHRPKVLFLDEPTLGLDAQTRRHIWDYIKHVNKVEKIAMILTTHYMEEADYLCERVAIIDHGKIIAIDRPRDLKDRLGGDIISLTLAKQGARFLSALGKLEFIRDLKRVRNRLFITVDNGERAIPRILNTAHRMGVYVEEVNLRKPSLEDVFLNLTGKDIRDEEGDPAREIMKRRFAR